MIKFITSQTFWTAVGSIVVTFALCYTIIKDRKTRNNSIKNIKLALRYELIMNINLLFSPEPERKPLLDVIQAIRKDFVKYIEDQNLFWKIQKLYSELDYYQKFIENNFGKGKNGEIEKKQCHIMNVFLEYFNVSTITICEDASEEKITGERNKGIDLKNKNISSWEKQLENNIESLFKS